MYAVLVLCDLHGGTCVKMSYDVTTERCLLRSGREARRLFSVRIKISYCVKTEPSFSVMNVLTVTEGHKFVFQYLRGVGIFYLR